jgi:cytochrome oxidase Cu insertion factor (SCO1/SenC/PrrC family)
VAILATSAWAEGLTVNSNVPDFQLLDVNGQQVSYNSLAGETTVITFISTACPVSNAYNERMKALYADYKGQGVRFVFVNSNRDEDTANVKAHAAQHGFEFAVFKDANNAAADLFGATVTPESYVIRDGRIVYHGRIDDAQTGTIKDPSLQNALDAVLQGRTPATAQTKAFGCAIKRVS